MRRRALAGDNDMSGDAKWRASDTPCGARPSGSPQARHNAKPKRRRVTQVARSKTQWKLMDEAGWQVLWKPRLRRDAKSSHQRHGPERFWMARQGNYFLCDADGSQKQHRNCWVKIKNKKTRLNCKQLNWIFLCICRGQCNKSKLERG